MSWLETTRSFVNTWECDENDHLNVQFYFERFEAADRHFRIRSGVDADHLGDRATRHVRYHSEMRASELILVHSAVHLDGPIGPAVVHRMTDPVSGRLTATALDSYPDGALTGASGSVTADASFLPRSQTAEPALPDSLDDTRREGAPVTYRGVILPKDCDETGFVHDRGITSCFTDGAAHAWNLADVDTGWFLANNMGRVAVEMKLTVIDRFPAGTPVEMITRLTASGSKTIGFRHVIANSLTGVTGAIGEVTALIVDLNTRRAVPLPERVTGALDRMSL